MAKITLTMDDGREVAFSGFDDAGMESLFKALLYYSSKSNRTPRLNYQACNPNNGPLTLTLAHDDQPPVTHNVAAIVSFILPTK